jgi:hypothetical protein
VDFANPVSFVSVRGYDGGGDVDTMVLEAYGAGDILIDSQEITSIFGFPGETATVTGAIEYVTFRVEGTTAGLFFDDLEWEGIVSVSPTSWGTIKSLYR